MNEEEMIPGPPPVPPPLSPEEEEFFEKLVYMQLDRKKKQGGVLRPQDYIHLDSLIYQGVGRNDPCPCGSGKKFKKCNCRDD